MHDAHHDTAPDPFDTPALPHAPLFRRMRPAPRPEPPVTSEAKEAQQALYAAAQAMTDYAESQREQLSHLCAAVEAGIELLRKAARPGVTISISLRASQAYTLDTQGYTHSYLLVTTASQSVTFDIPGAGLITRTLAQDWNRLDYPSGTRIVVAADPAAPINALLRLQDAPLDVS